MERRNIPWKAEFKAAGVDPGPLSPEEAALVPRLEAENQEFLRQHPFVRPLPRRTPLGRVGLWMAPLAAAAAVLVALSFPDLGSAPGSTGYERIKGNGDPKLVVYRQAQGKAEKLGPSAKVHPGDVLQAAYQVSEARQGALLSVDGAGNVTVHLAQNGGSAPLAAGGEHPLAFSYELDRAPKYEVFFLLVSNRPFDLEPIRNLLRSRPWDSLKAGAFGPDIQFLVLPLTKEVAP